MSGSRAHPAMPAGAALRALPHHRHHQGIAGERDDAGRVHPVLEQAAGVVRSGAAAVEQQAVEVGRIVAAEPAPQGQVLRPAHHLQSVDLHPADPFDRGVQIFDAGAAAARQRLAQPLRMQRHGPHRTQRIGAGGARQGRLRCHRPWPHSRRRLVVVAGPMSRRQNSAKRRRNGG